MKHKLEGFLDGINTANHVTMIKSLDDDESLAEAELDNHILDIAMDCEPVSETVDTCINDVLQSAMSNFGKFVDEFRADWPSWCEEVDMIWDNFTKSMAASYGRTIKAYCKPSGNPLTARLCVLWHYPTVSTTLMPEYGWTGDPSNCCMKAFCRRFDLELSVAGLTDNIFMMEHVVERYDYIAREDAPYLELDPTELAKHLELKTHLFELYQGPVVLSLGKANHQWLTDKYPQLHSVILSTVEIFGEPAQFRIRTDENGNVVQVIFVSFHMQAFWMSSSVPRGEVFDEIYGAIAAISMGRLLSNTGYFAWFAAHLAERRGIGPVHWLTAARKKERLEGVLNEPTTWPEKVTTFLLSHDLTFDPSSAQTPLHQVTTAFMRKFNPVDWMLKSRNQERLGHITIKPSDWPQVVNEYITKWGYTYNDTLPATPLRQVIQQHLLRYSWGVANNPVRWLKDARNKEKDTGKVNNPSNWPDMVKDFIKQQGFTISVAAFSQTTPCRQALAAIGALSRGTNPLSWMLEKRKQEVETGTTITYSTWPDMVKAFIIRHNLTISPTATGTPLYQIYSQYLLSKSPVSWMSTARGKEKTTGLIIPPTDWPDCVRAYATKEGFTYDLNHPTDSPIFQFLSWNVKQGQAKTLASGNTFQMRGAKAQATLKAKGISQSDLNKAAAARFDASDYAAFQGCGLSAAEIERLVMDPQEVATRKANLKQTIATAKKTRQAQVGAKRISPVERPADHRSSLAIMWAERDMTNEQKAKRAIARARKRGSSQRSSEAKKAAKKAAGKEKSVEDVEDEAEEVEDEE